MKMIKSLNDFNDINDLINLEIIPEDSTDRELKSAIIDAQESPYPHLVAREIKEVFLEKENMLNLEKKYSKPVLECLKYKLSEKATENYYVLPLEAYEGDDEDYCGFHFALRNEEKLSESAKRIPTILESHNYLTLSGDLYFPDRMPLSYVQMHLIHGLDRKYDVPFDKKIPSFSNLIKENLKNPPAKYKDIVNKLLSSCNIFKFNGLVLIKHPKEEKLKSEGKQCTNSSRWSFGKTFKKFPANKIEIFVNISDFPCLTEVCTTNLTNINEVWPKWGAESYNLNVIDVREILNLVVPPEIIQEKAEEIKTLREIKEREDQEASLLKHKEYVENATNIQDAAKLNIKTKKFGNRSTPPAPNFNPIEPSTSHNEEVTQE